MRAQIMRTEHSDRLWQDAQPVPDRLRLACEEGVPLALYDVLVEIVVVALARRKHMTCMSGPFDRSDKSRSPHIGKIDAVISTVGELPKSTRDEMLGGKVPGFHIVKVRHAEARSLLPVEHINDRPMRTT